MEKLSVEPYKGTRDFYPKDQFVQDYIFSIWKKTCVSFGYSEYSSSILESTELYKAKSGEEIISEQTYSFMDRGGREVTIRPEMTPTVARMVAQKRGALSFPLRWFSIPNLFRYERPQRGRLREHWQLNADLFGAEGVYADAEIVQMAYGIMRNFKAEDEQFVIHISSRKFLNYLLKDFLKLKADDAKKTSKLLDRMRKISPSEFEEQGKEILGEAEFSTLRKIIGTNDLFDLPAEVQSHESVEELKKLFEVLRGSGVKNIAFDIGLVRGFDYYTGIVFEVYDTSPENNRSLFGGGRYDNLVGIFGVEEVCAVGFGMGDVTIKDFLETHSLLPEYQNPVKLYICHLEGFLPEAQALCSELRTQGLNVASDLTDRKIQAQIKTADKEEIPYILVVGEEEVKTQTYKLKNLKTGEEKLSSNEQILQSLI